MNAFLEAAVEAALEAGIMLRAAFDRPKTFAYKGEVDLVTESDRKSEAIIVELLRKRFPEHAIVAEEGGKSGPGSDASGANVRYCWHVDPLDGTTNFAHGYPCFAVSIALAEAGEPVAGAVVNPISQELFTAARGEGAFLNERRIRVSPVEKLAASLVATGFPTHLRSSSSNIHYYWQFTLKSHGVRRDGSAALDLCSVACGRFDGFWEFGLNSWDTAAGALMVREAGGIVTDLSGGAYRPGGKSILASNGRIHAEMQAIAEQIKAGAAKQALPLATRG